ncbi:hypothetical protein RDI58_004470 [Solanum bulbocastanum]|uniref:Uncharacterized protein n=1 Tax=Solanum bulbocastanum TaxID=147425 RepID=A0AAN8U1D8_SOLBU
MSELSINGVAMAVTQSVWAFMVPRRTSDSCAILSSKVVAALVFLWRQMRHGKRLHLFSDMHQEPINVAKFAYHSPNLLVTSSFDRDVKLWDLRQTPNQPCYATSSSRGNVMVCFPRTTCICWFRLFQRDGFMIEVYSVFMVQVKQLLTVDGRLQTDFGIASIGSAHNYTRSYFMNGRDYGISGSSDESIVRICCAQNGRQLRDYYLEHFHMAVLASYVRPSSKRDIIKVNLVESRQYGYEDSKREDFSISYGHGG